HQIVDLGVAGSSPANGTIGFSRKPLILLHKNLNMVFMACSVRDFVSPIVLPIVIQMAAARHGTKARRGRS
ncbi:hypothetical protein, partial [Mesorhizobium sp.]|uniref:hypothetical protein n=1 Tax=Mesorhizobium sp. TaxID=1871066 RepID=UPI002624DA39